MKPQSVYTISDELLEECGLVRGKPAAASYRCSDPKAIYVSLRLMVVPQSRELNLATVTRILCGFRDGADIPAVEAFYESRTLEFHLLDGYHRWRAALALGYLQIPCELKTREFAEVARGYRAKEASE